MNTEIIKYRENWRFFKQAQPDIARKRNLARRRNVLWKGETRTSRRLAELCSVTATPDYLDPCDPYELPPSTSRARSLLLAISLALSLSSSVPRDISRFPLAPSQSLSPCRVESVSVVTAAARRTPNKYCPFAARLAVRRERQKISVGS